MHDNQHFTHQIVHCQHAHLWTGMHHHVHACLLYRRGFCGTKNSLNKINFDEIKILIKHSKNFMEYLVILETGEKPGLQ